MTILPPELLVGEEGKTWEGQKSGGDEVDENPCLEEQLVRGQVAVPDMEGEGRAGEVRDCQVGG